MSAARYAVPGRRAAGHLRRRDRPPHRPTGSGCSGGQFATPPHSTGTVASSGIDAFSEEPMAAK